MKRYLALVLALVMSCGILAGCGSKSETSAPAASTTAPAATETAKPAEAASTAKSDWPTRPVNVTVAASAGGATDIIVRKYAEKFQEVTGQPMVITNVSGAAAYVTTKGAEADGYNFGTMSTAFLTYKHQGKVDFSWDEAYDPTALFGVSGMLGFVVRADSQFQTINDLVDYAKANPGQLTVGNGSGTPFYWQLAFQKATDTDLYTVHLGDTNELNVALLGKQVEVIVSRYTAVKSYLESGDFKMLCFATENRSTLAPEVPTCKESGIDFTFSPEMVAIVAPKSAPAEALDALNQIIYDMQQDPAFAEELAKLGQEIPDRQYTVSDLKDFVATAEEEIMAVVALAEQ